MTEANSLPPGAPNAAIEPASQYGTDSSLKVGDLIEVPDVQTVVHLQDLTQPEYRRRLADSFVLTDEVKRHLLRLLASLSGHKGNACFLRGHYGAGKSHFLVFLQLLLAGEVDRVALSAHDPDLAIALESLGNKRFVVASVSLISHSSTEALESIISRALEEAGGPAPLPFPDEEGVQPHIDTLRYHLRKHHPDTLEQFLLEHALSEKQFFTHQYLGLLDQIAREVRFSFRPDPGRSVRFQTLFDGLRSSEYGGVILLIDELSEFLHARTGPGLTEDVRFLQFLGEAAREYPLFIIAALQEYLEAAEYGLPGDLVRKIKDRYSNNLELTTTHIEELIEKRLIHHRPGADLEIDRLYRDMRSYLQGFPVPAARFIRVYPVHPATILLLDRLKPLLSRSRGIVDFVHHRLKGSPERGIPGILNAPADTLLTPEAIYDHFQLRIRENLETAAYDDTVLDYYRRAITQLFELTEQQELALRLIKLLILLAISPEPRPYSVRTLTHALLVRISRIDPDANFQAVQDILDTMVARGAFVERLPGTAEGRSSFDDVYRLSLRADLNLVATRRILAAQKSLMDAPDLRIYEALAPGLQLDSLPMGRLLGGRAQAWSIQWQRTQRDGRVQLGNLTQVTVPKLLEVLEELETFDLDWMLYIGLPYDVPAQRQHLDEVLLPALRRMDRTGAERPSVRTFLFWLPEPLSFQGREGEFLRETLARRAVLTREREEAATSQTRALIELLEKSIEGDRARIEALFHQTWYLGQLFSVQGPGENLTNLGRPPFAQTLLAIFTPLLNQRFPEHAAYAPMGRLPTLDDVEAVVEKLYRSGTYTLKGGDGDPLGTRIISLLRPLKLVKKTGNTLTLRVDADGHGPTKTLLEQLGPEPVPLKPILLGLRKGPFGMTPLMMQLLVLGLAYAGAVVCYSKDRRREPGQLSALNFDQVTALGRSESVALDVSALAQVPFLTDLSLPRGELTFARQEQLWQQLKDARESLSSVVTAAEQGLTRARELSATRTWALDGLEQDLRLLQPLIRVGGPGTGARDGIEQFIREVQAQPQLAWIYLRAQAAAQFFQSGLERFLFIANYIERVPPIPETLRLAAVREELKEVKARLAASDVLYSNTPRELLEAAFRRFQERYIEEYREAHEHARGAARFEPLQMLRQSILWGLLSRLTTLKGLTLDDAFGPVQRHVIQLERSRCDLFKVDELRITPCCRCAFVLGQVDVEDDASPSSTTASLQRSLLMGCIAYLKALQEPEIVKALSRMQGALEATQRAADAQRLAELLAPPPQPGLARVLQDLAEQAAMLREPTSSDSFTVMQGPALSWLNKYLSQPTLNLIDQGLSGVTLIDERSLAALTEQLRDRCLSREELEKRFRAWMGVGATHIRIVD